MNKGKLQYRPTCKWPNVNACNVCNQNLFRLLLKIKDIATVEGNSTRLVLTEKKQKSKDHQ